MWILVYISLVNIEPFAHSMGMYDNMSNCFKARDALALKAGGTPDGHFPKGTQAVCIRK